jgi:hypothetical protein
MPNLFGTIHLYGVTSFTIYDLRNDKGECAMVEYIASIVNYLTALERGDSNSCYSKIRFMCRNMTIAKILKRIMVFYSKI